MNVRSAPRHRSIACCWAVVTLCALVVLVVVGGASPALAKGGKGPKKPTDTAAPVVEHTPITKHDGKGPVVVDVKITDDSAIFEPTLLVRNPGQPAFMRVPLLKKADAPVPSPAGATGGAPVVDVDNMWSAEVPSAMLSADVEYLVEAFDEHGNGPARVGDENAPLRMVRDVPVVATPPAGPGATGPASAASTSDEGGASTALIVTGVVVGVLVLGAAAAGTGAIVYFARPAAPTSVSIAVSAPSPVGAQ